MKTTGVVRRIDDLGRIVIPKELRRTMKIREGESLEIFVDDDTIALRKFSSMSALKDISDNLVSIVYQNIMKDIIVTDRDKVISCSGTIKKSYLNRPISKSLEQRLSARDSIIEKNSHKVELIEGFSEECSFVINPIIINGDAVGNVVIFSTKDNITDAEVKLAAIIAKFLGKYIEE